MYNDQYSEAQKKSDIISKTAYDVLVESGPCTEGTLEAIVEGLTGYSREEARQEISLLIEAGDIHRTHGLLDVC